MIWTKHYKLFGLLWINVINVEKKGHFAKDCTHEKLEKLHELFEDHEEKLIEEDFCDACWGSGRSYWSDGIYGNCLMCCCIDCGKNCRCTKCDKCSDRIIYDMEHKCKLCVRCNNWKQYDCTCEKCIKCNRYEILRTNKHCDKCYCNEKKIIMKK